MTSENWKPVAGFDHSYEVSNLGRVRSLPRSVWNGKTMRKDPGRILASKPNARHGYVYVSIAQRGSAKSLKVSRLVLEAFVGPAPPGMEACHNNGIRSDDRLENLRWDTRANNHADKVEHGTAARGSKQYSARLTDGDVHRIRDLVACGCKPMTIAKWLGVPHGPVYSVRAATAYKAA